MKMSDFARGHAALQRRLQTIRKLEINEARMMKAGADMVQAQIRFANDQIDREELDLIVASCKQVIDDRHVLEGVLLVNLMFDGDSECLN